MHPDTAEVRETAGGSVAALRVSLLGGFRVERHGRAVPDFAWQRRSAKRLTKLLATSPSHALHREQILETFWPNADFDSARNSLAKALHAARRALEPELLAREDSCYLRVRDDMISLDTDHVLIDADDFQRLAQRALRLGTASAYEEALAAYGGELLPEDLYEDWPSERRDYLADLNVGLLLGLAETMANRGAHLEAVVSLRSVLQDAPTREDVHRQIMHSYRAMGAHGLALRQFDICRTALRQELDVEPDRETTSLYQELLTSPARPPTASGERRTSATCTNDALTLGRPPTTPFVGRELVLEALLERLARSDAGHGGLVIVSGEAGVGKTRLVARFALEAQQQGMCVLGDGAHAGGFPYGPFAAALEGYVAGRPEAERAELARRYPALGWLVPSVEAPIPQSLHDDPGAARVHLATEITRLLTEVAETQTVVVMLGDLDEVSQCSNLELLEYIANLARHRRWLMIGTLRDEALVNGSDPSRLLTSMTYEHFCDHLKLQPLQREECDRLVGLLLGGHVVASDDLDHLYSLTHGNPLFVEELLRDGLERGTFCAPAPTRNGPAPESFRVPPAVRALVERTIARLGPSVRRVLELVAAAGREVTLDELRNAAAGLQPPLSNVELFDALDRLLGARIMVDGRDAYAIRHALVRAALLEELPRHRLAQLSVALRRPAVEVRSFEHVGTRGSFRPRGAVANLG